MHKVTYSNSGLADFFFPRPWEDFLQSWDPCSSSRYIADVTETLNTNQHGGATNEVWGPGSGVRTKFFAATYCLVGADKLYSMQLVTCTGFSLAGGASFLRVDAESLTGVAVGSKLKVSEVTLIVFIC